jgi:hypothetical protein
MLHRLGVDAALTLGNKKAVDIVVTTDAGVAVTIDVKAVANPYDWPASNVRIPDHGRHFLVLVCFEGRIRDSQAVPSVWVIPAQDLRPFLKPYKGRTNISRARVLANGERYRNAWQWVTRGSV